MSLRTTVGDKQTTFHIEDADLPALLALRNSLPQLRAVAKALEPLAHPFAFGEPTQWQGEMEIDCCVSITYGDVQRARDALADLEEALP